MAPSVGGSTLPSPTLQQQQQHKGGAEGSPRTAAGGEASQPVPQAPGAPGAPGADTAAAAGMRAEGVEAGAEGDGLGSLPPRVHAAVGLPTIQSVDPGAPRPVPLVRGVHALQLSVTSCNKVLRFD
jgi:hypothetical protein